jgi:hypothetical protein
MPGIGDRRLVASSKQLTGLMAERRKDLKDRVAEWEGLSAGLE